VDDGSGSILDQAVEQIPDEALRARIAREVELLRGSRRFGLVFDRHLPESVRLPDHPVRKGTMVTLRDESTTRAWRVLRFADAHRTTAVLDGDGGEMPTDRLVVIREFGEPVYPGLRSVERIAAGPADAPWHVVINGENFHVLQALRATRRGKVDLIYIDPPYNTGNDGWIYNDRYVDTNDRAKSSKWLSFMERRLLLARDLLKPTGVIVVAIGDEEQHRLRMLLDQVFGSHNFLANVVWQGSGKNDARYTAGGVDYMLAWAKNEEALTEAGVRWRETKPGLDLAEAAGRAAWEKADEALGVFEHVTRPRISTVVTGVRPDGSRYSDGLAANVEMFDVTYLDPGTVRRGREFAAIAALMWIEGGATGERIVDEPDGGWALTPFYGVLITIDALAPFADAVTAAAADDRAPSVVFVVTDSPTEYQHAVERLPVGVETVQLYQDYLANYTINVEGGAR